MTWYRINRLFVLVICCFLFACSNKHKPAPVVDIVSNVPATQYKRGSLKSNSYTVKKGETLYSIAWRSNIDVNTLAKRNNIKHPYKIFPGQKISLDSNVKEVRTGKTSKQNLNNYSTKTAQKELKKAIDPQKNQEYGGSVSRNKASKQTLSSTANFSKKIRKWQWPAKGKILSTFSTKQGGNKGLDIAGSQGDKIVSAADGVVVYAGDALRGYGRLIIVKHNDDYLSAYAHNDVILVKEQQVVKAGQQIANMGDTDAKRVMLHFEVRFRGKSVNPMKYLPRR